MKKKDIIDLKVTDMIFPSKGVGVAEGKKVIVKGGLEGQTIRTRIKKNRKDKAEGMLLEVVERADYEVDSFCPHFGRCGGCARQTVPYEKQLEMKGGMIQKLLADHGVTGYEWGGVLASPVIYDYRNKMEFSFGDEFKDGPTELGMHKKGRHYDVVTVDQCKISGPDFNAILKATHDHFVERGIRHFDFMRGTKGFLRNLNIRQGKKTGEILVGLSTSSIEDHDLQPWIDALLRLELQGEIVGILQIVNDMTANVVEGDYKILYGRDWYMEKLYDLSFKVSFYSFFQTNPIAAELLYDTAMDYMDHIEDRNVFDLFSGTGTIAQIMARKASHVTAIEIVEDAVKAAKENAAMNGIDNCDFLAGDVFKVLENVTVKPDVIVVDPPRAGITPKALDKILSYGVKGITYISCGPRALAENLAQCQEAGYEVKRVVCVDMFPHTPHVEVCTLLKKIK